MTASPKLCFVIMPFSKERKEVFTYGIAPACKRAGFEAVRVDQLKGVFNINRKIIEHLFCSDVVIAEITDKNPNVFYEMGVSHAIGNKTIMIAQSSKELPFDISNYRCLIYEQSVEGLQHLQEQIFDSLQELEKWSKNPSNPVQDFKPEEACMANAVAEDLRRQLREAELQLREKEKFLHAAITPNQWQKLQAEHQRAQADLKTKEQAAAQQLVQMEALQKEAIQLRSLVRAANSTQGVKPKLQFRAVSMARFSEEKVSQMLKAYDFYDRDHNTSGNGVTHKYEPAERSGEKLVIDHATGLTWQQAGSAQLMIYKKAEQYIRDLNKSRFAGYEGWRLPTLDEAMSLMEHGPKNGDLYIAPEFAREQWCIWTVDSLDRDSIWVVNFNYGSCFYNVEGICYYVRAVR